MNLLLDTHAFIWFVSGSDEIPLPTRQLIQESTNRVFVSMASMWEMAIKYQSGNLQLRRPCAETLRDAEEADFEILPIAFAHPLVVSQLPLHHRDPFDRLLTAQAQVENLTLVSRDPHFPAYEVPLLW